MPPSASRKAQVTTRFMRMWILFRIRNSETLQAQELLTALPPDCKHAVLFIVDEMTTAHPESPILVVDCHEPRGRGFRAVPSQLQGIENNLSIANMDIAEFADSVDCDGIFRGFQGA